MYSRRTNTRAISKNREAPMPSRLTGRIALESFLIADGNESATMTVNESC